MDEQQDAAKYISELIARARKAQAVIEFATQEQVDEMATRVAWSGVRPDFAKPYTKFCAEETRMGIPEHKYGKQMTKVKGTLRDMKGKKSVGIVENNKETGIIRIAKPVGVIGALIPVTNGEATPFVKAISAIKTRNAIIMAPHPRAQKTNNMAVVQMRKVLKKHGWPEDLIIGIEEVTVDKSKELMKQCDLILATGGGGMVKAAYSSGTPSQGVGAGNAVCIVDEDADLKDAADKIMRSKTFDHATSCSTENSIIMHEKIYDKMVKELEAVGGYLCNAEEKKKLQAAMWDRPAQGQDLHDGRGNRDRQGLSLQRREAFRDHDAVQVEDLRGSHRYGQPHHGLLRTRPFLRHSHLQRNAHPPAFPRRKGQPHHDPPAPVSGQQRRLDKRHAYVHDPRLRSLGRKHDQLQRDVGVPAKLHLGLLSHPFHYAYRQRAVRQGNGRGLNPDFRIEKDTGGGFLLIY
jgi:hypothetical protein